MDKALIWYETLLERPADFSPEPSIAEWQLYPGCWLVVVDARPDPGRNRTRLGVADLVAESARIRSALNIPVTEPTVLDGLVAYCDFEDPDGNRLGLFQDLSRNPLDT